MKKWNKRKKVSNKLFLLLIIPFVGFMISARALNLVTYNANEWDTFKNRTKEEIGKKYSEVRNAGPTYKNGDSSTYYDVPASTNSPYAAGTVSQDTLNVMTAEANYYRWLVGVSPLTTVSTNSEQLQLEALVRNWNIGHVVDANNRPSDFPEDLWKQGSKITHNILSWYASPRASIANWLSEGYSLSSNQFNTVGHRMAIIGSSVSELNLGYSGRVAIGAYKSGNTTNQAFTAFPAPGYMPYNGISVSESAWTVQLNSKYIKVEDLSNVVVKVTNVNTGDIYTCTKADGTLSGASTLVFKQPKTDSNYSYKTGDKFKVEITGLTDVATGNSALVEYTTEFFNVTDYADATVKSLSVEGFSSIVVASSATSEDLSKIAKILPTNIKVNTDTGRTAILPVSGNWQVDEVNKKFTNTVDKANLPSFLLDPDGILDTQVEISYTSETTGSLSVSSSTPIIGTDGYFQIRKYYTNAGSVYLYQIKKDGTSTMRFDENSSNMEEVSIVSYKFNIDKFEESDSGTYIGAYTVFSTLYIAGIKDVNVKEKELSSITVVSPTKNTYKISEDLSVENGKVNSIYEDNSTREITLTKDMINGYDKGKKGVQTLTVTYLDKTTTYKVLVVDNPSTLQAKYGDTLDQVTLPVDANGVYSWNNKKESVGNVGTNKFAVTYTPNDSKYSVINDLEGTVIVEKAIPSYTVPSNLKAEYGDKLKDITLPEGFTWLEKNLSVGSVGTKQFIATYTPDDTKNYQVVKDIKINVLVEKAIPEYTIPNSLKATYGSTLKDVILPEGFKFQDDLSTSVGDRGTNTFKVTYTPRDTTNYTTVKNILVKIAVERATLSISGLTYTSKMYDKRPVNPTGNLVVEGNKLTIDDLVVEYYKKSGENWNKIAKDEMVNIGEYKVIYKVADDNSKYVGSVTYTYEITKATGVVITVTGNIKSEIFDGLEKSVTGYTYTSNNKNFTEDDFSFTGSAQAKGIAIGKYEMGLKASDFVNTNENFDKVTFKVVDGYLKITDKIELSISGLTYVNKVYDGSEVKPTGNLVVEENKVAISDLVVSYYKKSGESWNKTTKNAMVDVGEYKVTYEIASDNSKYTGSVDYTYEITKVILSKPTIVNNKLTYNKQEQAIKFNGFDTKKMNISGKTKETNAGNYTVDLALKDKVNYAWNDGTTNDITLNWKIQKISGVVVEIIGNTKTEVIDGTEKMVEGYTYTTNNKLFTEDDFSFTGLAQAKGIAIGKYEMGLKTNDFVNINENFEGVIFKITDGYLELTDKRVLVIDGLIYNDKDYTGKTYVAGGKLTITDNLLSVDDLEVLYVGIGDTTYNSNIAPTNVGTYKVTYQVPATNSKYMGSITYTFAINKAVPSYTVPTGLEAERNQKLSSINLPEDFNWNDEEIVLTAGINKYMATYTPKDVDNYMIVDDIEITVDVKDYRVVDGANQNYIINVNTNAIFKIKAENTLIDKVFVDGIELTSEDFIIDLDDKVITLLDSYLTKIDLGEHNLKITLDDGESIETKFNIQEENNNTEEVPKTLDNFGSYLKLLGIGVVSLFSLLGIGFYLRKKKYI